MNAKCLSFALVALGVTIMPLLSQKAGKGKGGSLSLEGKPLPDVVAYDETGSEFPLVQKLKGRHAVIVFGCLT